MARALSGPEWSQFMQDVNISALNLPPWGGVVQWNGLDVLVFISPADGSVWTTDITDDFQSWIAANENQQAVFDPNQQVWYYQLPQQTVQQFLTVAKAIGALTQATVQAVAQAAGQAAGAILSPTVQTLSPILIAGIALAALAFLPRR